MYLKYLSYSDRHMLEHTNSIPREEIIDFLDRMLHGTYTMQRLWEFKKWFYLLTEDEYKENPTLLTGLIQIHIYEGELDKARERINQLPPDSAFQLLSRLTCPGYTIDEYIDIIKEVVERGYSPVKNMTLTLGRPSVISGLWDISAISERIISSKSEIIEILKPMFPDQSNAVYQVALAECLYQRDQCYDALVKIVGIIPFLKNKQDMRLLFVALTLEIYIMVINGQSRSTVPLMDNLREQIKHNHLEEYLPNIDALDAWAAMYDGDYKRVTRWMREDAPDEYGCFCMLDLFRYMVKMRVYIIQGKQLLVTALATRLFPILTEEKRYMDLCELHLIVAMSDHSACRGEEAYKHVDAMLELAERYRYDRLIADEGIWAYKLLKEYKKSRGKSAYLDRLIKLAEKTAGLHPRYLKNCLPEDNPPLTDTELKILRLLQSCYTNAEIADVHGIALDTVKQHCKHICSKLNAKNRHQAVRQAVELGILEPVE